MVQDADRLKEEDRKKRALVDAKNEADSMVYQTEKNLKEYKDRLDPDGAKRLEQGIEDIKSALRTENTQEIKSATERLSSVWQDVAQRMYQNASAQQAQSGPSGDQGPGTSGSSPSGSSPRAGEDSKPVDADYEIIDDEGKK